MPYKKKPVTSSLEISIQRCYSTGYFLQLFTEPREFNDEVKHVIKFFEQFVKANHITFKEIGGLDYRIDLQNQFVYGPRPLTENELLVFLAHIPYLWLIDASNELMKWLLDQWLQNYTSLDPKTFKQKKKKFYIRFK